MLFFVLPTGSKLETFTSAICVTLIDAETVIKEVELIATVGTATLAVSAPDSKIFITKGKCQHFPKIFFQMALAGEYRSQN